MDPGEVGEAALGERPDEVQRRRRLVVRLHEALGVGRAGAGLEQRAVDDVAAERRQVDVADALGGAGAGLGELAGDAPDLHDRHAERVGQHDRHLEDDAQLLPDVVGRELLERLGAVAGLEEERVAGGDLGERGLQRPGLAGEDERGIAGDGLQRPVQLVGVRPLGLLPGRMVLPGGRRPCLAHRRAA